MDTRQSRGDQSGSRDRGVEPRRRHGSAPIEPESSDVGDDDPNRHALGKAETEEMEDDSTETEAEEARIADDESTAEASESSDDRDGDVPPRDPETGQFVSE